MAEFKFINLWQSKEERAEKYALCRALGAAVPQATRMRDWRLSKIERLFALARTNKFHPWEARLEALLRAHPDKLQFNIARPSVPCLQQEATLEQETTPLSRL